MAAGELYRALWRRKFLIAATLIVAVGAAIFYTKRQPTEYRAWTLVRIQQRIANSAEAFGALQTGGRLAQTYAKIAGTTTIAQKVADRLGNRVPPAEIRGSISGTQLEDLELLAISATASRPRYAQLIANAAPGALRSFIKETGTLRDNVVTVEPATLPHAPISPSLRVNVAAALILGVLLGGGLALLFEFFADRAHGPEELERLTRRPVLASVGRLDLLRVGELAPPDGGNGGRVVAEVDR